MTWTTIPDGNVSVTGSGLTHASGLFSSAGPYGTELTDPQVAPSAGSYFAITLPAGTYTGNVRLTVLTNTLSSVYDHHLFLESSTPEFSGNPVPVDVYEYDIGSIVATDVIFCPAGVDNGSGADSGALTFNLEFETEEPPEPLFWTDLIGTEELAGGSIVFDSLPASGSGYISAQLPLPRALLLQDEMGNRILGQVPTVRYRTLPYILARLPLPSAFLSDAANIIRARLPAAGAALASESFAPSVNVISAALPIPFAKIKAGYYGQINAQLPKPKAFLADADGLIFGKLPPPSALLYDNNPFVNYALMVQSAGIMWSYSLDGFHAFDIEETVNAVGAVGADVMPGISERIMIGDQFSVSANLMASLEASGIGSDAIGIAWVKLAESTAVVSDTAAAVRQYAMMITDSLVAVGLASCTATAMASIAEAAVIEASANGAFQKDGEAESDGVASDAVLTSIEQFVAIMEQALAQDQATPSLSAVVLVEDSAIASDALITQLTMLENINEVGHGFVTIRLGGVEYTAWVMNTSSKSLVEYRNFSFNSFAEHNGKYYGINESGLYVLEGDDDDGEEIEAWIKDSLRNLGTSSFKRLGKVYLGIKTDGNMLLKVVHTSDSGDKTEDWYQLEPRTSSTSMKEASVKTGDGISSVYFSWELRNIDGCDFDLDTIKFMPVVLDRRH